MSTCPPRAFPRARARCARRPGVAEPRSAAIRAARPASRVLPIVVEQTAHRDSADGLVRDWPLPICGVEKHRIYMFQWYHVRRDGGGIVAVLHAAAVAMIGAATARSRGPDRRSRRTLLLIALVAIAPVIASYAVYYLFPRTTLANYGELLPPRPAPASPAARRTASRSSSRACGASGCWRVAAGGAAMPRARRRCTRRGRRARCRAAKWTASRASGSSTDDGACRRAGLAAQHPDLSVVRVAPRPALAAGAGTPSASISSIRSAISCSRCPREPDIKRMGSDLTRLLQASRIG